MPQFFSYRKPNLRSTNPGNIEGQRTHQSARTTRWNLFIFLFVWSLSAAYAGVYLNRGWEPKDEGTLGQTAERVLNGEMPHRDFANWYTGGLTYVDALIFKMFGVNLFYLRLFLFAFFLAWIPAVYAIARHFLEPLIAGGVSLLAVLWSIPNYPAAMPSWFSLFLTTFGILALATYIRRPATRWLMLAGFCGGISFLIKSVALYYLAGALLFFVYREQTLARKASSSPQRTPLYSTFVTASLALFVLALVRLVYALGHLPDYFHFVFPGLVIAILVIARESKQPAVPDSTRLSTLLEMVVPFILSAAVPILLFFMYFWWRGSLHALMADLFVGPFRAMSVIRSEPVGLLFEYPAIISALLTIEASKLRGLPRLILSVFLAACAAIILVLSSSQQVPFVVALTSAWGVIPVLAVAGVGVLYSSSKATGADPERDQTLLLLLCMTALFSIIQFPYASGYFCYVAPLAILLAASLLSRFSRPPRAVLYSAFAFYALFAALVVQPHFLARRYKIDFDSTPLTLPRAGGIRVSREAAMQYAELIPFVQKIAGPDAILAAPDCPEVYFLAGISNPTPIIFDSLEDTRSYEGNMKSLLDRPNFLKAAVLHDATVSGTYQLEILRPLVVSRFPNSRKIGSFTVYWRP
jgi:hypothetical protein